MAETASRVAKKDGNRKALQWAMGLSLCIGILMLAIKMGAYLLTGSAAILSDAAESVVHVAAVGFAAYSLRLTFKPPDADHLYGHTKVSFFSAGFEGGMIILAALYIIYESSAKWLRGLHLENLGIGTGLTALAMVINVILGVYLLSTGRKRSSIILEANGKHVLTDVWTSLGVLVGLGLTLLTGWLPWDPICAILVALNILYSGAGLIRRSVGGLMDYADPQIHEKLLALLQTETTNHGIKYHGLRHRNIGDAHWVEVHLLFPTTVSVGEAHRTATAIENALLAALAKGSQVTTHLEAIEDHQAIHSTAVHKP